eukprot:15327791-Ditylum_brightwellii.AAC.1
MILDSGATKHMSGLLKLFKSLHLFPSVYNGYVVLGDGSTKLPICGIRSIIINVQNKIIQLDGVLYVPDLQDMLFSTLQHGRYPDCSFLIKGGCATLEFPNFKLEAKTEKEITVDIAPLSPKDPTNLDYVTGQQAENNTRDEAAVYLSYPKARIPSKGSSQSA